MEIISDTTDMNGRRRIVARYTAEEKSAMAEMAAVHRAETERNRVKIEAAHKAKNGEVQ